MLTTTMSEKKNASNRVKESWFYLFLDFSVCVMLIFISVAFFILLANAFYFVGTRCSLSSLSGLFNLKFLIRTFFVRILFCVKWKTIFGIHTALLNVECTMHMHTYTYVWGMVGLYLFAFAVIWLWANSKHHL